MSDPRPEPTSSISISVSYRGTSHKLSVLPEETLLSLQTELEQLTNVPPHLQKLLYKGKKPGNDDRLSLEQAGIKNGMKIQMLGTTEEQLGELHKAENDKNKRDRIMRERALKPQYKVRSTAPTADAIANQQYRFHKTEPLPHLPNPPTALAVLNKLAADPAIKHVMQMHKFSVGLLTELAPHEDPSLLGLNVNAGQAIKLRLRTDIYDGFRPYLDIRKVLCHELAHNVHGDHDENFKELNSRLNREVTEYERRTSDGTHYLSEDARYAYQPASELEAEARAHILGGGGAESSRSLGVESADERRRRILEATMNRLKREEEEMEQSCGTSKPST